MAVYVSRRASLGIAKEATRGTPVAPTIWIPYADISFDDKIEQARHEAGYANIADSEQAHVVKKYAEGSVKAELYDKALGAILMAVFGAAPSSSAGPTNYTHTFTLQENNQHQSLSLYIQDPNGTTMFPMTMVDKFEFDVKPDALVEYSIDFRARGGQDWGTQTPAFTSLGNKFLHQHFELKLADTIAGLAAASPINVRSFKITISKALMDWDDVSTVVASDILNRQFSVEGEIELAYSDRVYRNYMLNETYKSMQIKLVRDATTSILTMQLPRVDFSSWEPNKKLDDIATQKIDFKANYDVVNSLQQISTCTLINQQSSY